MISITEHAQQVMHDTLHAEDKKDHAIRIRVVPGGCSGFSYKFDLVNDVSKLDIQVPTANAVQVVADPDTMRLISGSTLDYVTNQLGGSFQFQNPNASRSCGCGESFSVE